MKITLYKQPILEQLTRAVRFCSNKISTSTALQGVFIHKEKEKINFYSTNLNLFYHGVVKSDQQEEFRIIIEPKKIIEFLSLLNEEKIEVEIKNNIVIMSQKNIKGSFPLIKQADFPLPPRIKEGERRIEGEYFLKNLSLVLFSTAKEEGRPTLTGVNFISRDEGVCFVSTDGFRLSLLKTEKQIDLPNLLIPAAFLEEVMREIKKEREIFINYSKEEKLIALRVGKNSFYSRLIEGEFPPFEKVIPTDKRTTASLDKEELLRNVKIVSVFAREAAGIIICEFKKNKLFIRPKVDVGEENITEQETQSSGEEQRVAFNYRFIIDFLNNTEGEKIIVEILRPDAPVVFKTEKNKNYLHIIMPVRLQE